MKRSEAIDRQRPWTPATGPEIGAFFGILLYMRYARMPRVVDYWTTNPLRPIHGMVLSCMSWVR